MYKRQIWDGMDPLNVDLMACTASVLRYPVIGVALPFLSYYHRTGSAGTDVLA